MTPKLQDEIKQNKPFASVQEELWLNLSRTASALGHSVEQHLRPYGLSPTQYNVLRILRGAGPDGLCQADIGDRLVAQVPDVPRILDRMEKAGWVKRERGTEDRRVVMASLTERGAAVVGELDGPLVQMMAGMFEGMTQEDMQRLNDLLVAARA
jgi:DNA-binding MarR family transcriptional regulator